MQLFGAERGGAVAKPFEHAHGPASLVFAAEIGGALGEDFHHGNAFVADGLLQDAGQLDHMKGGGTGYKGRASAKSQGYGVELPVYATVGCGGGHDALAGKRRKLAAGHAVDAVVEHKNGEIDVAAAGVDEVVAADGQGVAVAHGHDDVEGGPGELDACGAGQSPSVHGVHAVEIHVPGDAGGTAYAGHHAQGGLGQIHGFHGAQQTVQNHAVAAARAPDMREKTFAQILSYGHGHVPLPCMRRMTLSISVGVTRWPSMRLTRNTRSISGKACFTWAVS